MLSFTPFIFSTCSLKGRICIRSNYLSLPLPFLASSLFRIYKKAQHISFLHFFLFLSQYDNSVFFKYVYLERVVEISVYFYPLFSPCPTVYNLHSVLLKGRRMLKMLLCNHLYLICLPVLQYNLRRPKVCAPVSESFFSISLNLK